MSRIPDHSGDGDRAEPPDLHALAGEYVLGTLAPQARHDFAARLPHDAALRAAVDAWEARLLPLAALVEPVTPSAALWARIDRSIMQAAAPAAVRADPQAEAAALRSTPAPAAAVGPTPTPAPAPTPTILQPTAVPGHDDRHRDKTRRAEPRWSWNSLALWRMLTAGAFAMSAVLAVLLVQRSAAPAAAPQFMVVLVGPQDKAPGWVIQANMKRELSLIPLGATAVPTDKALQFWTKGEGWSGPVSLGLVRPGQVVQIPLDRLPSLQPNQLFELTLEPVTGSPTGKPTGPVQFIGRAVKVM